MEHPVQEIPRLLRRKGWGLFPRPSKDSFTVEEAVAQGMAEEIRSGVKYDLLPRASSKESLDRAFEGEDFYPRVLVPPDISPYEATSIAVFSGDEEEFCWPPGEEIIWTGLELLEATVKLFTPHATYTFMSLRAFLKALESMPDISDRLARQLPRPKARKTRKQTGDESR